MELDTSMINSIFPERQRLRMERSTVAPRLSEFEMKQNCLVWIVTIRICSRMVGMWGQHPGDSRMGYHGYLPWPR